MSCAQCRVEHSVSLIR
ncbi:hypothetical protein RSAG8_13966, partial [Rhizoctonia solani AG-8 WAC10335]